MSVEEDDFYALHLQLATGEKLFVIAGRPDTSIIN